MPVALRLDRPLLPYTLGRLTDTRSRLKKVVDFVLSLLRNLTFSCSRLPSLCSDKIKPSPKYCTAAKDSPQWKEDSEGLYLLVHGLKGHPSAWDGHLKRLKKAHPEADIRLPKVPFAGNCPLEKCADPLLDLVRDYIVSNPGKPVCLIGLSNGARIVSHIEINLRRYPTPIKVSTIAGALYGSRTMDLLHKYRLSKYLFNPELVEELRYGSKKARTLLDKMRQDTASAERDYEFYSSTEDSVIAPYTAALPVLGKGEKHYVCHAENHNSIVDAVAKQQIASCVTWMKSRLAA